MTATTFSFEESRIVQFWRALREGSPALTRNSVLLMVGFVACLALPFVDDRLFNGINVWHKPAKFFVSLAVHLATLAWALSLVGDDIRDRKLVRWTIAAIIASAWLEMIYIVFRAARAEGSHYNVDQPIEGLMYSLMGVGALILTLGAAVIGFVIWRNRNGMLWREAMGVGLMLGAFLGTATAAVLSAGESHWIGGAQTDANGLPLFFWSTTGGDLRVAHFVGLHAMQIVPFAALSGKRSVVYGVALAITVLTGLVFAQAIMGLPVLRP